MNSTFKFRLQKVLDIRQNEEDLSKMEFRRAMEDKINIENTLSNLKNNYEKFSSFNEEETLIEKKLKIGYLKYLDSTINKTNEKLDIQNKILEEKRENLKEKQIKRKTVQVLKDKQYAEFLKEEKVLEQKVNDELALYSFIRKVRGGK